MFALRLLFQPIFTPNPHFSPTVHAKRLLSDGLFDEFFKNISYFRYHLQCIFSYTPSFLQYPPCENLDFMCTSRRRPNVSPLLLHSKSQLLQYIICEMPTFLFVVRPLLCHQLFNGLVGFAKRKEFVIIFIVSRGRNNRGYTINDFSVWLFLWGSHFSRVLKNDDAGTTGVSWARSQPASLLAGRLAGWLAWDASGKHKTPEPGGAWGSLQCEVGIDSGGGVTWPQVG